MKMLMALLTTKLYIFILGFSPCQRRLLFVDANTSNNWLRKVAKWFAALDIDVDTLVSAFGRRHPYQV